MRFGAPVAVALALSATQAVALKLEVNAEEEKPLNFTAILNGDAWKHKKAELAEQAAARKAKAEEKHKEQAVIQMRKHVEAVKAEKERWHAAGERFVKNVMDPVLKPKYVNYTKKFENNSLLNGSLFMQKPTTTPPPLCEVPRVGEKIVYFVHVGEAEDKLDGMLTSVGEQQADNLQHHANLSRALGKPKQRAQVVITGAARKTMETAILGFRDLLPNATWEIDPDVEGIKHEGEPAPALGTAMLKKLGEDKLLSLYNQQIGVDHGGHEHLWQNAADRWHAFMDRLRQRPEDRFIVVTHEWGISMTGLTIPVGGVGIAALVPNPPADDVYGDHLEKTGTGAWRHLSGPACWPARPVAVTA